MKRVSIVFMSALFALSFQPVLAESEDVVCFLDELGDLGHPVYALDGEHHSISMIPAAYWPDASPVGSAGYLDMTKGTMRVDETGMLTAELIVASPLTDESVLPQGVKAVWWTWFFSKDTSLFYADYAVHVCWDGSTFDGFVLLRGLDDPVRPVSSFLVVGHRVAVEFDGIFVEGSIGWFAESICWDHATPQTDQGFLPSGGWFPADITDGPFLPWLPMPT